MSQKNGKIIFCKQCTKSRYVSGSDATEAKYCSRRCYFASQANPPKTLKCLVCTKEFKDGRSRVIRRKYCSQKCAKWDWGEKHKGGNTWLWKGGRTTSGKILRSSKEYVAWRKSVFIRDGYACVWCGAVNGRGKTITLHADHIKPFAYFSEHRFDVNNGRTLCVICHRKTFTYLNNYASSPS